MLAGSGCAFLLVAFAVPVLVAPLGRVRCEPMVVAPALLLVPPALFVPAVLVAPLVPLLVALPGLFAGLDVVVWLPPGLSAVGVAGVAGVAGGEPPHAVAPSAALKTRARERRPVGVARIATRGPSCAQNGHAVPTLT
jgi:hypothetical protein